MDFLIVSEREIEKGEKILSIGIIKKIDVFFLVELFEYHLEKFSLLNDPSWLTDEKERAGGFA